jgi:hypothetical protein
VPPLFSLIFTGKIQRLPILSAAAADLLAIDDISASMR